MNLKTVTRTTVITRLRDLSKYTSISLNIVEMENFAPETERRNENHSNSI